MGAEHQQLVNEFGLNGLTFASGTGTTSGTFYCASFTEASVIGAVTITGADGDTMSGISVPAGFSIYGVITSITLTSGKVILYKYRA